MNNIRHSMYQDSDLIKRLQKEAKRRRWSFNNLLRYILENWLKRNGKGKDQQ